MRGGQITGAVENLVQIDRSIHQPFRVTIFDDLCPHLSKFGFVDVAASEQELECVAELELVNGNEGYLAGLSYLSPHRRREGFWNVQCNQSAGVEVRVQRRPRSLLT